MRVLAVMHGLSEAVGDADHKGLGPLEEFADIEEVEVRVLRITDLEDISKEMQAWQPTLVYVSGGLPSKTDDLQGHTLSPLPSLLGSNGAPSETAVAAFQSAFAGLPLEAVFLDFDGSGQLAQGLLDACNTEAASRGAANGAADGDGSGHAKPVAGLRHVLAWPAGSTPMVLPAWDFAHVFFGMLRTPGVTVPEAYALASRATLSRSIVPPPASPTGAAPAQPVTPELHQLLPAGPPPALPACASITAPRFEGVDLSRGMAAAFPGYSDLRLLAPNAELRLLLAGVSAMVNPHNLKPFGEALRGLLASQTRALQVSSLAPCARPPPHLAPGCGATRCEVRTPGGAVCTVTLGGPSDLLANKELVQHALRLAMTADAHTLQLKAPPPGVPPPPTHASEGVACGAPVVEGLAVTSVWCVQMLKLLAQDSGYRGLALLGVAAVSTTPVAAFGKGDSARVSAVVKQLDAQQAQSPAPPAVPPAEPPTEREPAHSGGSGGDVDMPDANGDAETDGAADNAAPEPQQVQQEQRMSPAEELQQLLSSASPTPPALTPAGSTAAAAVAATVATAAVAAAGAAPVPQPGPTAPSGHIPTQNGMSAPPGDVAAAPDSHAAPAADDKAALMQALAVQQQLVQQQQLTAQQRYITVRQAVPGAPAPWKSGRPPMSVCTEEEFISDLIAFLTDRQGRQIDPRNFPEAILNGGKLDLFNLYKEVSSRGGYKVGNGINWKGQVFPRMRNFTTNHRMTGVGNALKRHYQVYLLEYEQAHPDDTSGDRCAICGRGDDVATDWVCCDACDCWVHFSCDLRQTLGAFKEYSKGQSRVYHCPSCSELRRQQQVQAATAAQMAPHMAAQPAPQQQQQPQPSEQQQQQGEQSLAATMAALSALAAVLKRQEAIPMQEG